MRFNSCIEGRAIDRVLDYYVNDRGWETIVHLLKPRNEYSGYLLAIRERATGLVKEELADKKGLAYWNHAVYYNLTDSEARTFKSICDYPDDISQRHKRFSDFYDYIYKKAFTITKDNYSIVYAVAVYGGTDGNTLKGYIIVQPKGFDYYQLKKTYDLWSWTVFTKGNRKNDNYRITVQAGAGY